MSALTNPKAWAQGHQTQAALGGLGGVLVVVLALHAKKGTAAAAAVPSDATTSDGVSVDQQSMDWIYAIQGVEDLRAQMAANTPIAPAPVSVRTGTAPAVSTIGHQIATVNPQ